MHQFDKICELAKFWITLWVTICLFRNCDDSSPNCIFIFSNFFTFQNLWKPFLTWRWNFGKKQLYFYVMVTWSHAKTFLQNISFKKFYFLSLEEDNKKGHKMCQMALNLEGRLCWCWCQPKRPLLHEHAQSGESVISMMMMPALLSCWGLDWNKNYFIFVLSLPLTFFARTFFSLSYVKRNTCLLINILQ